MLVNLTPNQTEIDRKKSIAKEHHFEYIPQNDVLLNPEPGIYQCTFAFNFSPEDFMEFEGKHSIPYEQSYKLFAPKYKKSQYGVADSVEQLKKYFSKEVKDTKNKYFIYVTPVYQDKENKFKGGGWRWHKWGSYIGKLDPQCEYLDDEEFGDDFEYVLCYHIIKLD